MAKIKRMNITQLRKNLSQKKKTELIEELVELYKRFKNVKEYYTIMFSENDSNVLEKYKDIITDEFYPRKGFGKCRLSVAKKAISDYKKISSSITGLIDIMLHYIETGSEFLDEYQVRGEEIYDSVEGMFINTLKLIKKNKLMKEYRKRCKKIVEDASDAYGFQDILEDDFQEYFEGTIDV